MHATARSAAFVDIDGTLTDTTSMFDFLSHHLTAHGRADRCTALRGRPRAMAQAGLAARGDHVSDVAFMNLVGGPVVVGHDDETRSHAAAHGQPRMGSTRPARAPAGSDEEHAMTSEKRPVRIAVVGAYGNGKTTLTTELSRQLGLERTHGAAMRDPADGSGKSLEECSDAELIQLAVRRFTERLVGEARLPQGFVSDGSVVHEWVYTKIRLVLGRLPAPPVRLESAPRSAATALYEEVADQIGLLTLRHARDAYDLVVHLPADVPLPEGHRPISEHFRRLSDRLLLETLQNWRIPVHVVTGSVQERVQRCLELAGALHR